MRLPTNERAATSLICVVTPSFGSLVCGVPLTDMKGISLRQAACNQGQTHVDVLHRRVGGKQRHTNDHGGDHGATDPRI